jgi:hypothetical protein
MKEIPQLFSSFVSYIKKILWSNNSHHLDTSKDRLWYSHFCMYEIGGKVKYGAEIKI